MHPVAFRYAAKFYLGLSRKLLQGKHMQPPTHSSPNQSSLSKDN